MVIQYLLVTFNLYTMYVRKHTRRLIIQKRKDMRKRILTAALILFVTFLLPAFKSVYTTPSPKEVFIAESSQAYGNPAADKETDSMNEHNDADVHFNLGVTHHKSGRYEDAIAAFEEAVRMKPDDASAYYNLGVVYHKSERHEDAIESYGQAIHINPLYSEAYYNLGVAYNESGMHEEAITAFREAVGIKPDYVIAHSNLGVTFYKSGMYEEAITAFKEAVDIKPDYAIALYNLGVAYYKTGVYEESFETLKEAVKNFRTSAKKDHQHGRHPDVQTYIDSAGKLMNILKAEHQYTHRTVYTIQTGSFMSMVAAQKQFDSITERLSGKALDYLRIEKIGNIYSVRLGKFDDYISAAGFLETVRPRLSEVLILKAFIKDDRIVRLYTKSSI